MFEVIHKTGIGAWCLDRLVNSTAGLHGHFAVMQLMFEVNHITGKRHDQNKQTRKLNCWSSLALVIVVIHKQNQEEE